MPGQVLDLTRTQSCSIHRPADRLHNFYELNENLNAEEENTLRAESREVLGSLVNNLLADFFPPFGHTRIN